MELDINEIVGDYSIPGIGKTALLIREEVFVASDTNVSVRQVNHWESIGLIANRRSVDQRWRRFNFVEFVWIHVLQELRKVGVGLKILKKVKENFMTAYPEKELIEALGGREHLRQSYLEIAETEEEKKMVEYITSEEAWDLQKDAYITPMQMIVTRILLQRVAINLIAFANGDSFVIEHSEQGIVTKELSHRMMYEPHATVSITSVINEFIASDLAPKRMGTLQFLEENEQYILKILKSGEYSSVTVNFKDAEMSSLKLVRDQTTTRKIVDILNEAKYQDIQIKTHNGIVTKIENTVKVNL